MPWLAAVFSGLGSALGSAGSAAGSALGSAGSAAGSAAGSGLSSAGSALSSGGSALQGLGAGAGGGGGAAAAPTVGMTGAEGATMAIPSLAGGGGAGGGAAAPGMLEMLSGKAEQINPIMQLLGLGGGDQGGDMAMPPLQLPMLPDVQVPQAPPPPLSLMRAYQMQM